MYLFSHSILNFNLFNFLRYFDLGAGLQTEVENLALHLFYMTNAKEDIRGDIAVMRRAAEKADAEVGEAELEKQRQVREALRLGCHDLVQPDIIIHY